MNKLYVQWVISWVVVLFVAACTSASTPQSRPTLITPQSKNQIESVLVSLQTLPEEQQESLGDLKTVARKQAEERMSSDYQDPRYLFLLRYDPAEDWAQVTAPVLALFAEFDDTVAASQNQPALEEALSRAGNDDVTIKTVPGVNHLFLEATSASPAEWTNLSQNLAPEAADLITNWILERTEASSEKE